MPQMIEGTPFKNVGHETQPPVAGAVPYSERKTPPRTPTGMPMSEASPRSSSVPTMALAMPPPASPTGFGSWVKKSQFTDPAPFCKR